MTICSFKGSYKQCSCEWNPCPCLDSSCGRLGRGSRRNLCWQPGPERKSFSPPVSEPGCSSAQSGQDLADRSLGSQPLVRSFPLPCCCVPSQFPVSSLEAQAAAPCSVSILTLLLWPRAGLTLAGPSEQLFGGTQGTSLKLWRLKQLLI